MDIRTQTGIIIKRGTEFLVGTICYSKELRWTTSPWEAWRTRKREEAEAVAAKVGGEMWLFKPVAGQMREFRKQPELPPVPAEYEGDARSTWWYVCGECHTAIDYKTERCPECGRRIRWKESI